MIAIDGSPLRFGPESVARMVRAWLAGWPKAQPHVLLTPGSDAAKASAFRRTLAEQVVDAGASGLLCPWMAVPDLRALGVPVVGVVHELPFVRHGPIEGRVRAWKQRWWLRRDKERCAALLVPSKATRDDVLTLAPALAERLVVVPHGFDPVPWEAARCEPASPPYAVMVGVGSGRAHARKKGLDVLLDAWRQAAPSGWQLALVGEPALPVPQGVRVHPILPEPELRRLVAGAALLVYPSRMEGFGFPPLEAMAAGVPVLTTDAGSIPEVVGDAALIVPAGDAAALAKGLRQLASDEGRRADLCARGAVRARAFPVAASAQAVIDTFTRLGAAS